MSVTVTRLVESRDMSATMERTMNDLPAYHSSAQWSIR